MWAASSKHADGEIMWARIKRIFRAIIGWFIDLGESPEMILKQNIKDMQDQVPAMNENLALLKAQVDLTAKKLKAASSKEEELTYKIKAALKNDRRDMALNYATTLEGNKKEVETYSDQTEMAKSAYQKADKVKRAFFSNMQAKVDAAQRALSAKEQAKWQSQVADAMESFQVAGMDATHDEMIDKIDRDAAKQAAKLEIAMGNLDSFDVEEDAKQLQANDTLRQFEIEMGLNKDLNAPPEAPQEKSLGEVVQKEHA